MSDPIVEPLEITDSVTLGDGEQPMFLLGPCVIESEEFVRDTAEKIAEIVREAGVKNFVFKASYDKANRSSASSFRGMGCRKGCEILAD
ncbi:MAG: 3-deoxy-8-phosphooctulonate synthase, partial [Verrucomicrobiales bacterium]|nr:3-deoxy-8-phosphooctulonate synthase [Verrucomicrobiales bacterium]